MKQQNLDQAYDLTTGRGRLAYLADVVLARVERERLSFDLQRWTAFTSDPDDCGTAACAVGWACRDILLRAEGFVFVRGLCKKDFAVSFNLKENWDAVTLFFDITFEIAVRLFDGEEYPSHVTPADVAARIRAHLAETA